MSYRAAKFRGLQLGENDMRWWRDCKFGMFIHWGLYALLGRGEWVMWNEQLDADEYAKLAGKFKAKKFDPGAWARTAKEAGMKYMVLTSRHHDGFSLWPSSASWKKFDSMHCAAKRDFVREYVAAVRRAGLKVGLYYSPLDWRMPGYFFPKMYRASALELKKQTYLQVRELLKRYGPLDILWYDGGGDDWLGHGGNVGSGKRYDGPPLFEPERMNAMVRKLAPKIVMSDRSGIPLDFASEEGGATGRTKTKRPWERCSTLAGSWGYTAGAEPRSLQNVISELVVTVVRDGNLLLNVGPMADGRIHPDQVKRLKEVGAWLKRYGESIYGTRGGPIEAAEWGGSTSRGGHIYIHVLKWPKGSLPLRSVPKFASARCLTPGNVKVKRLGRNLKLTPDSRSRRQIDSIIVLNKVNK